MNAETNQATWFLNKEAIICYAMPERTLKVNQPQNYSTAAMHAEKLANEPQSRFSTTFCQDTSGRIDEILRTYASQGPATCTVAPLKNKCTTPNPLTHCRPAPCRRGTSWCGLGGLCSAIPESPSRSALLLHPHLQSLGGCCCCCFLRCRPSLRFAGTSSNCEHWTPVAWQSVCVTLSSAAHGPAAATELPPACNRDRRCSVTVA